LTHRKTTEESVGRDQVCAMISLGTVFLGNYKDRNSISRGLKETEKERS